MTALSNYCNICKKDHIDGNGCPVAKEAFGNKDSITEQREIKFRAKTIDTKKWVYGYYYVTLSGHCFIQDFLGTSHLIDNSTLGQYTGLDDKQKTEIFEGDILDTGGEKPVEIVFKNAHFAIKDDASEAYGDCPLIFGINGKVIGNIHDEEDL